MINIGLFFLNLGLQMGFVYWAFHSDIGGGGFSMLFVSPAVITPLLYSPLRKMLKKGESGYFYGLGSLFFIVGLSQILGFLVYMAAENGWANGDYESLTFFGCYFGGSLVLLITAYSASYGLCRALWKT